MPARDVLGDAGDDGERRLHPDSRRVHIVEAEWLDRLRTTRVYAYRLPEDSFSHDHEVGGYWLSRETVVPAEVVELADLVARHEDAKRVLDNPWPTWNRVIASSLEFSGIRLHNAQPLPV